MHRDGVVTTSSTQPCARLVSSHTSRHARRRTHLVVAIGVVLFTVWTLSISSQVFPVDHRLDNIESYLAGGESVSVSTTISAVASVVASSPATIPSKEYNNNIHSIVLQTTKRSKEERKESLPSAIRANDNDVNANTMTTTNSSVSMVEEELPESLSRTKGSFTNSSHVDVDDGLPTWVTNYFSWHRQKRLEFPDQMLFIHPDAPKVLVKYCKWQGKNVCGGLYDRTNGIPNLLYVANRTNRVLLLKWYEPMDLETFLLPAAAMNWTVPHHDRFKSKYFFKDNLSKPRTASDLNFLEWALTDETARDERVLIVHREANGKDLAKEVIAYWGETATTTTTTTDTTLSFGNIWRAMFRPSPLVQKELDATMDSLGLVPGKYSATHCRVRHPGRFANYTWGKNGGEADISGLPWYGPNKDMAIKSAVRALKCSHWISSESTNNKEQEPVYFYSDSEDLVHHLLSEKKNQTTNMATATRSKLLDSSNETDLERQTRDVLSKTKLAARDLSKWPTAHLDRQAGLPAEAYVSTFVDLYIAASARCIAFGVGNFGYMAAKISGTKCLVLHEGHHSRRQARMWNQQSGGARKCRV
jgi:hypothetical protein